MNTSLDASPDIRRAFEDGLTVRVDRVYRAARGRFPDHRGEHPWVTGCLGDVFAPVWFVAENPSLTQVKKLKNLSSSQLSPELQWTMSAGDRLLRRLLVRHGFKEGSDPLAPGGWHCYLTDVIKSTAFVKEHAEQPVHAFRAAAQAWAPVLSWELEWGRPRVVVCVGNRARALLNHLIETGAVADPAAWGGWRTHIPHYVYVASRPDIRRKLGAAHPLREAEYDQQFATIAAVRDALPLRLRVSDGREYLLGTPRDRGATLGDRRGCRSRQWAWPLVESLSRGPLRTTEPRSPTRAGRQARR